MDAESLLAQAPQYFENKGEINLYKPRKITDIYGYQYLVKGAPTVIKGAIHTERFLEENPFGNFGGASIILSTHKESEIVCGDLIEANGEFYAIAEQKPINDKTNEYDFVCYSIYDYYKDFLIDDEAQANQILGNNSMRYILPFESSVTQTPIPLIPSKFKPNLDKYISVDIIITEAIGVPYKKDKLIHQNKRDRVVFYSLGLDTNDLQEFLYDFFNNANNIGFGSFPNWSKDERYNKEFDLRANIYRCEFDVFYSIITNRELEAKKLIEKLGFTINGASILI